MEKASKRKLKFKNEPDLVGTCREKKNQKKYLMGETVGRSPITKLLSPPSYVPSHLLPVI